MKNNYRLLRSSRNCHFSNVCPVVNSAARRLALFGGVVCLTLLSGKFLFSGLVLCFGCVALLVVVFGVLMVLVVPGWGVLGFMGCGCWLVFASWSLLFGFWWLVGAAVELVFVVRLCLFGAAFFDAVLLSWNIGFWSSALILCRILVLVGGIC
ncbi:uncharacterized protein LOC114579190 [Dendrobium catenatum]|uniref:uncharacterized protein LOC114579190 n=1 Tax=Dendrobium catenatum TaxID=906689 RepID=UPI00109F6600|nr:uncharacterized protein LOC114579190 [Dendrobium catenatum]